MTDQTIRVDLHCHTHRSPDSDNSYRQLVAAVRRARLGALAITDHNRIEGALQFAEVAPFPVIVGEEVRTTEGEIIGLFIRELIPPHLSPEETIAEIRRQGGVVYVPHPLDRVRRSVIKRAALDRVAPLLDAVEVLNGRCHSAADNGAALAFAERHGLLKGAGSDAHIPYEVGRAGVEMPPFTDAASFKEALKSSRVFGRPSTPLVHLASTITKYRKKLLPGWAPF